VIVAAKTLQKQQEVGKESCKKLCGFQSKACGLGCLWYALLAEDVCNLKPTVHS